MFEGSDLGKQRVYTFLNNKSTLLKVLPPTYSAYEQHIRRAALAYKPNVEPCEDYGWTVDNGYLVPVQSTRQAWPQQMMHTIYCGCIKGCSRNCSCAKKNIACIYLGCRSQGSKKCGRARYTTAFDSSSDSDNDNEHHQRQWFLARINSVHHNYRLCINIMYSISSLLRLT